MKVSAINLPTVLIGGASLGFLFWVLRGLKPLLLRAGLPPGLADRLAKAGPVVAIAASSFSVWCLSLDGDGVAVVGAVPQSLPPLTQPSFDLSLLRDLALPAALISLIGFVESVSVGQTLAAKRHQHIEPNQDLVALGAANLGASFTGGFPVTGGFARSVVNFDAQAETPAARAFTAVGLALAALFLTPLIAFLPKATLAATIVVPVLSLVDLSILKRAFTFSRADFAAVAATMAVTLGVGVEAGVPRGLPGAVDAVGMRLKHQARRAADQHQDRSVQYAGYQLFRDGGVAPHVAQPDRVMGLHQDRWPAADAGLLAGFCQKRARQFRQARHGKGLGQEGRHRQPLGPQAVVHPVLAGHDDDRHIAKRRAGRRQNLDPIAVAKVDIRQYQIKPRGGQLVPGFTGRSGMGHHMPTPAQRAADILGNDRFVFQKQDTGHHVSSGVSQVIRGHQVLAGTRHWLADPDAIDLTRNGAAADALGGGNWGISRSPSGGRPRIHPVTDAHKP